MTKYALIRKAGKGEWYKCFIQDKSGREYHNRETTDKSEVERNRDNIKALYPREKYAILEIRE